MAAEKFSLPLEATQQRLVNSMDGDVVADGQYDGVSIVFLTLNEQGDSLLAMDGTETPLSSIG